MILIADSGGSKTDWALVGAQGDRDTHVLKVRTQGLNPFHQSEEFIRKVLEEELKPAMCCAAGQEGCTSGKAGVTERVSRIAFYGAGCTETLSPIVSGALAAAFPSAEIKVESDLLGAAHAVCGHEAGIACILGTGANSCLYDGKRIVENVPPLGYILGDEGSGAVLGKLFLNGIFKGDLPAEIREKYLAWSGLTYREIIDKVYRQPLANRFLAGISVFLRENLRYAAIEALVCRNFDDFFQKNILKYASSAVRMVSAAGGVASAFEHQLRDRAHYFGYQIGKVVAAPIDGLIDYYT